MTQETKFSYSQPGKVLEKQVKTIEEKRKKQAEASPSLDLNNQQIQTTTNKINLRYISKRFIKSRGCK